MNPKHYKSIRNKPKSNSAITKSKSLMIERAKDRAPITSPKLREVYATKIEWATKILPELKEK